MASKYRYSLYDYDIRSDIKIFNLAYHSLSDPRGKIYIRYEKTVLDENYELRIDESGYHIKYGSDISFTYDVDTAELLIMCASPEIVPSYIANAPLAPLVAYTGGLLLHSCSICVNSHAYLFLAPCGGGKSTLLQSLIRCNGVSALSDDALAVYHNAGTLTVAQGSQYMKLTMDTIERYGLTDKIHSHTYYTEDKYFVSMHSHIAPMYPYPLRRIYLYNYSDAAKNVSINRLDSRTSIPYIVTNLVAYRNLAVSEYFRRLVMRNVTAIHQYLPLYKLVVPAGLERLDEKLLDTIISHER